MREEDRDRVSRLGTEAWKRLKKCRDYFDWVKVGEAMLVGREWAMNQAQANKPEGKAYNLAMGEWLERYRLDDMDKGDRSRLFQMMDALPQIEEWRRRLTMTERLKLNHPQAVLRKWKAAFEVPDTSKPAKPGLRESVAQLSEENVQLKSENEQLKAHAAEVEATLERGIVPNKALLWLTNDLGMTGHRSFQARTVSGAYHIMPRIGDKKRGSNPPFIGYAVRYTTEVENDLRYSDDDDFRIIRTEVQSEGEAKAIAQADFEGAQDEP